LQTVGARGMGSKWLSVTPAVTVLRSTNPLCAIVASIMREIASKYGYDLAAVELDTCPVCNKKFKNHALLASHLRGQCGRELELIKDKAVDTYAKYRRMIRHYGRYYRAAGKLARTIREAVEILLKEYPP